MTNNDELAQKATAAVARLREAISGANGKYWAFTPAIKAVLAERDADKKHIAKLEARTVSVKLPKKESEEAITYGGSGAFRVGRVCGFNQAIDIMSERLTAAGFKLEVGE